MWVSSRSKRYCCITPSSNQQQTRCWLSRITNIKSPFIKASSSAILILILINNVTVSYSSNSLDRDANQVINSRWSPDKADLLYNRSSSDSNLSRSRRHQQQSISDDDDRLASHDRIESASHYEPMALVDDSGTTSERSQQVSNLQQKGKRTLYACEERQLPIECGPDESIQLIRANYGRFSIQICNDHGQLDWKVNCMSPQSFQIISNSCQAKQSCQLLASNSIFGDACPGTQKYLEVHYQCVAANQTLPTAPNRAGPSMFQSGIAARPSKPNVIQPPLDSTTSNPQAVNNMPTINSERPPFLAASIQQGSPKSPALPPWVPRLDLSRQQQQQQNKETVARNSTKLHCPEIVRRQIRWPSTEAGMFVQMPCPQHAQPGNLNDPYAASFACLPEGVWAPRGVQAARCQSLWLRNLTLRLEAGDSPLSMVAELVSRTAPFASLPGPLSSGFWFGQQQAAAPLPGLFGDDLVQLGRVVHRLVEETGLVLSRISDDKQRLAFGRDLVQALVDLINNLLHEHHLEAWMDLAPIAGERQHLVGQLVQDLEAASVQLAGALNSSAQQQQQKPNQPDTSTTMGQESFVKVTDNVYVTIKSFALQPDQAGYINRSFEASFPSETSLLGTRWMNNQQSFTMHLQASGAPNPSSSPSSSGFQNGAGTDTTNPQVVAVKYSPMATPLADLVGGGQMGLPDSQGFGQSSASSGVQVLKIVFLMVKKLEGHMDPLQMPYSAATLTSGSGFETNHNQRMFVNSNLVSMSIVADPRFKYPSVKVDLSAPIELVFRHTDARFANELWSAVDSQTTNVRQRGANSKPRCVYWDNVVSDWQSDGCKLVATNKTHSTCACNHLTSFALLSEWEEQSQLLPFNGSMTQTVAQTGWTESTQINGQDRQHHHGNNEQQKVQLDSVENELILPNKLLYLAKLLDGHLFDQQQHQQRQMDGQWPEQPPQQLTTVESSSSSSNNLRLIIYLSCLISAALFTLHLAAAAYNQAQARRLLGAIPANPPPPLLVSNSNGSAAQLHPMLTGVATSTINRGANLIGQGGQQSSNNSEHTSPTYGSSSIDYSAALDANRARQLASSNPANHFYDHLTMNHRYQCVQKLVKQQLSVPIHLIVQLLALELIVILLVESQDYLQRMQATRRGMLLRQHQQQSLQSSLLYGSGVPASEHQGDPMLDPIGLITWTLMLTFYYLIASIFTWLMGQLLELNSDWLFHASNLKSRTRLRPSNSTNSSMASDKSIQYGVATATTNSTAFASSVNPAAGSLYAGSRHLNANQLYLVETGQASCYGQPALQYSAATTATAAPNNGSLADQQPFQSSTSPSSSLSSAGQSVGEQHLSALNRLEADSARLYGHHHHHHHNNNHNQQQQQPIRQLIMTTGSRQRIASKQARFFERFFGCHSTSHNIEDTDNRRQTPLNKLLVHLFPVLLSGLIAWLSIDKTQTINSLLYTSSLGSQLAYWPLLVDCSSSGLSLLLYYVPALCLVLASFALFSLCRPQHNGAPNALHCSAQQRANFMMDPAAAKPIASSVVNPYGNATLASNQQHLPSQVALNKQTATDLDSSNADGTTAWRAPFVYETKRRTRAKFLCIIILALLALHSICWISFFAHIRLALNARNYYWDGKHLIVAFAASNLLFASLIVGSQRRLLRRAAKLVGLGRLLAACCCCSSDWPANNGTLHGRAWFYRDQVGARQKQQVSGAGQSKGANPLKVSPSSQSLFLISQAAQQQQHQQQQQQQHQHRQFNQQPANYHYGPTYSSGSSQAAQHLYQQLANNNGSSAAHIYDSASTLNEHNQQQQQQRFNMMQMMQQQQQQLNHQYNSYTLNRPPVTSSSSHHQQLAGSGQFQSNHQARGQQTATAATLKPMSNNQVGANNNANLFRHSPQQELQVERGQPEEATGQLLTLDASAALKLHWSGEAEGPLVAFGGCTSQSNVGNQLTASSMATFGPNQTAARSISQQQQQLQEDPARQQRHLQQHLTEHQLFNAGLGQRHLHGHHSSRPASPMANNTADHSRAQICSNGGHQYCAPNQASNYTDALRAAMIQQQNELTANASANADHHIRRPNVNPKQQRHLTAAMLMANGDDQRLQVNGTQCNQFDKVQANIYDVANYALNQ